MDQRPDETAGGNLQPQLDVSELQTQFDFEQQQSQLAQLRDTLQRTQQSLTITEKEKENHVATLSRIRMQRRSKGSSQRKRDDPSETEGGKCETPVKVQTMRAQELLRTPDAQKATEKASGPGSAGRVKVNLLTQGVEEKRQWMEKVKRMNQETKQSIEGMAEKLKVNLPEKEASCEVMGIETASELTSPMIDPSSDKSREMYAQILYKDNKIIELNNRILELERNIMDYQENLREKDCVLEAKARSITLITDDMSRRNKISVDALEETRREMRDMQNQFVELETQLRAENKTLAANVSSKEQRLNQLEALRFELSTRNAELQQKVVALQTRSHEVLAQGLPADKERIAELTHELELLQEKVRPEELATASQLQEQLEESLRQVARTKNQYGKKIKSLEKQLAAAIKSEELQLLQNRVAELEEEKGNLQLHLVDYDEIKVNEQHTQNRLAGLQEQVQQQSEELISTSQSLAKIEAEKLQLAHSLQQLQASESELQAELEAARAALQERENAMVEAEMKAVELEDQVSTDKTNKAEMEAELASSQEKLKQAASELQLLRDSLSSQEHSNLSSQQELTALQEALAQSQGTNEQLTSDLALLAEQLRSKTESYAEELRLCQAREESLSSECMKLGAEMQSKEEELRVTMEMQGTLGEEVDNWRTELQKQRDEVLTLKQQLEASQTEFAGLREENLETKELQSKLAELSQSLNALQAAYMEQTELIQHTQQASSAKQVEHEAEVEALELELEKKQQRACDLEEQLAASLEAGQDMESQLETVRQKLEEIKKNRSQSDSVIEMLTFKLRSLEEQNMSLQHDKQELLDKTEELKQEKSEGAHALQVANTSLRELQQELERKNSALHGAEDSEQKLLSLQAELTQLRRKYQEETTSLSQRAEQAEDELSAAFSQADHSTREHRAILEKHKLEQEEIQAELAEQQEFRLSLEDTVSSLQDSVASLQVQLGVVVGEKEALESEIVTLKESLVENNSLKQQNDLYAQQIHELQMELSNEQQLNVTTVQALRDENNNLKTQLQQSNNFVSQLQAQMSSDQHNISSQLHALQEENRLLKESKEEGDKKNSELQVSVGEIQNISDLTVKELKKENALLEEELKQIKQDVLEIEQVMETSDDLLLQSRQQAQELQAEISVLSEREQEQMQEICLIKHELSDLDSKVSNLKLENSELKEVNQSLHAQLQERDTIQAEIISNNNELQATLNERDKSSKDNVIHLNTELEGCRNHIRNLEITLVEQTRQLENYEADKMKEQEYCNKLANELLESQNFCQMLQNVVSDLQSKIQALQKAEVEQAENFMALSTQVKESEDMNRGLQEELLGLHRIMEEHPVWQESSEQVHELRLQLQHSEKERQRLAERLLESRGRLQELEGTESLQTEIENLQMEVVSLRRELETARHDAATWEEPEHEGWGDAGLEEQHMQQQHVQKQQQSAAADHLLVTALQAQLTEAEQAQLRLQEELKVSQVRCGKLIKQVKNLKDQLVKYQPGTSSDLDIVLEQELQAQLTSLNKQLAETQAEKESLLAKTETLVTANERLVDMKEQQDQELERSRAQRAALMQQLNALLQWQQPDDEDHALQIADLETQLRQARDKCVELEEALEAKLLQDHVDNLVVTQEVGVATESLEVVSKCERSTSPMPSGSDDTATDDSAVHNAATQDAQVQSEGEQDVQQAEALRTELEAKTRELRAREAEHHSLAAYIAQLRGALEVKSQELAAYSERPSETELRTELDSALYMLHQRDVRCDELTLELMALMEERDALQLRLSSALRQNEQQRLSGQQTAVVTEPPTDAPTQDSSQQEELHSKLSELRALGHTRDVSLRGEQEVRNNEQRQILLQPSTARPASPSRETILDSDHTLTRDTQSTSSVLLNWLWGRSTPRVHDL